MSMGLAGSFGAAGAGDAIETILARRMAQRKFDELLKQQAIENQQTTIENQFKSRQLEQADELKRLDIQARKEMATQGADLKDQSALDTLITQGAFQPGQRISPNTASRFQRHGVGDLLMPTPARPATLPARQSVGQTPDAVRQGFGPMSAMPVHAEPAMPAGFLYTGTGRQADAVAEAQRKVEADRARVTDQEQRATETQRNHDLLYKVAEGQLSVAQLRAEIARDAAEAKLAAGPKLAQRENDTVVSIHQMTPLVDELLQKTRARMATRRPPASGWQGTIAAIPEKIGRVATKGAYAVGLPVAPADNERIQLASLLQILGTVPYLRGIRNMQFVHQIQQHLADPSATDESLIERLTTLKRILPGMEQAIYDVHNHGQIPHAHEDPTKDDPLGILDAK